MHGCPADEIERMANHLLAKGLHTRVKCNPTMLGYHVARALLDDLGYAHLTFDDHHFVDDLQHADAVPMFTRLRERAHAAGLVFGVKLSNTLPTDVTRGELPASEMYLSGRALLPLTLTLAATCPGRSTAACPSRTPVARTRRTWRRSCAPASSPSPSARRCSSPAATPGCTSWPSCRARS